MAGDNSDFCRHCGAKLMPGEVQCHECSHMTGQMPANTNVPSAVPYATRSIDAPVQMAFKGVTFLIAIYAVIFIVVGATSTFFAQVEVEYLRAYYGTTGWNNLLAQMGMTTDTEYINQAIITGAITLISALFALITLLLVIYRKHCMVAVMSCAVGALVLLMILAVTKSPTVSDVLSCILQCIIGLLVARMVYRLKPSFES